MSAISKGLACLLAALTLPSVTFSTETNRWADSGAAESVVAPLQLRWLALTNHELEINGLPWFEQNHGELVRLPTRNKSTFRKEVWSLANCPSGGRIRFRTDSTMLAIRLEYSSPPNMANMQAFGQTGVDVYLDGTYLDTAIAARDAARGKTNETILFNFAGQPRIDREVTLYLPLYKPVKVLGIGVDEKAKLSKAKNFTLSKPVVFYGTSITQGGCASRPGMSYEAILGRKLNIDFVNLGFSGNGLGEPEVARAVSEINASCYVLDFGANHKTGAAMRQVYEPFLEQLRKDHPVTPIVVMTLLYTARELRMPSLKKDWQERRDFIEQLVRKRIQAGDKNLFLVDGATLLGPTRGDGLVDGSHPNDLGFYWMAENLIPAMKQALGLQN